MTCVVDYVQVLITVVVTVVVVMMDGQFVFDRPVAPVAERHFGVPSYK